MSQSTNQASSASGLIWLRIAVVYFVIGVALGVFMGAKGDFSLVSVHSHVNVLGWEALALVGLIYRQLPEVSGNGLARTQFWLHNLGLPALVFGLAARELGSARMELLIGGASAVIGFAVVLFAVNILFRGRKDR